MYPAGLNWGTWISNHRCYKIATKSVDFLQISRQKCCRIWGGVRNSLDAETVLRVRILRLARIRAPARSEEMKPQLPPGTYRRALMMGWPLYCFIEALEHSNLLSLTNEKTRLKLIILALLSSRPIQYIYLKLNIKSIYFLAHKLSSLLAHPHLSYIIGAETSGNSSFPYEYRILWFEKVQKL